MKYDSSTVNATEHRSFAADGHDADGQRAGEMSSPPAKYRSDIELRGSVPFWVDLFLLLFPSIKPVNDLYENRDYVRILSGSFASYLVCVCPYHECEQTMRFTRA